MPATPDPVALADLAERLAVEAGTRLLASLGRADAQIDTKSTATDMVTDMDRATEQFLVEQILAARPDDTVYGEEGADHIGTSGVSWWLDPIDGTTNFVYGIPGFNISVAAELDGQIVAGVVVDPLHGDFFRASRGAGATRNGEPIHCNTADLLATALVSTGFSYEPERRRAQAHVLARVLPEVRDVRRIGAAATDLCWVACGRVDAYYERGLNVWDYAAGALIAHEAGALVSDLDGGPPSTAFTLAAAPGLAQDLRKLLRSAGAAEA